MASLISAAVPLNSTDIQTQLRRLLADVRFAKSPQLSRFLRYCVERTLAGDVDLLKEQVLGTEVFRRSDDFDPRLDPIVRVEARRLRQKLEEYYDTDGRYDPVIIMFPRGEYVPRFSRGWAGTEHEEANVRAARILIVEDERLVARDIETRLKNFGYEVVASTGSGEGAVAAAEKFRPDLVLMDIVLSGAMRGTEAAQTIWKRWRSPVVYLTAFSDAIVLEEVKGSETYGYVLKPYEPRQLKGAIEIALSRRNKERQDSESVRASQVTALRDALEYAGITAWEWEAPSGLSAWPQDASVASRPATPALAMTPDEFLDRILPTDRLHVIQAFRSAINSRSRIEVAYRLWLDSPEVTTAVAIGSTEDDDEMVRITGVEIGPAAYASAQAQSSDLHQFLLAAGHDLQEPLRSIGVYAELLARNGGDLDESTSMVVGEIRRGVDRMRILLSDLVSFAQVVEGDNRNRTNFELDAALDQALQNLAAAVAESGAVVHRKPLPEIWGIESQFVQVFQNLLSNSIKYRRAEEPLVIEIRSAETDLEYKVSVSDNGGGFECEYAEQIFSAFKRLHGGDIQGTGIGLTICRRVLEAHGGRIWAESEPGRGARFHFCLPRLSR